jgi:hypothetical protein
LALRIEDVDGRNKSGHDAGLWFDMNGKMVYYCSGSVLIVGLLALSLPLSAILAARMANSTANVIATATIMSLVIMEGPPRF